MLKLHVYNIAGFRIGVTLPEEVNAEKLLPSFHNFCDVTAKENEILLFNFNYVEQTLLAPEDATVIEENESDLGHTVLKKLADGYRIELHYDGGEVHVMHSDTIFTRLNVNICWKDRYVSDAVSSLLRIAFAQAILLHKSISVHASSVILDDRAYLFMGRSGTGKSTHSSLWQKSFQQCELLNDDNPVLRVENAAVIVYGTPWSGKTPCYKNKGRRVKGIVRLKQAPQNIFTRKEDIEGIIAILPGCSVIRADGNLYEHLFDTLTEIIENITVGELECLPNEEAAHVCFESFTA